MTKTAPCILVVGAVFVLVACANSSPGGVVPRPMSFSVPAVRAAFATKGIVLRSYPHERTAAFVGLLDPAREVTVYVRRGRQPLNPAMFDPPSSRLRTASLGNVVVTYRPPDRARVTAALSALP